jgi:hypothetical protein
MTKSRYEAIPALTWQEEIIWWVYDHQNRITTAHKAKTREEAEAFIARLAQ